MYVEEVRWGGWERETNQEPHERDADEAETAPYEEDL